MFFFLNLESLPQADNIKIQRYPVFSFYSPIFLLVFFFVQVPFSSYLSLLESKSKKNQKSKCVAQRYYRVLKHVLKDS